MGDLSANFMSYEFACKGLICCGGSVPMNPALVASLQLFRDYVDAPVVINSGFRCITHNVEIGGTQGSQHTFGRAVDIKLVGDMTIDDMVVVAERIHLFRMGGIGRYETWLHLDVGPLKRRWDER